MSSSPRKRKLKAPLEDEDNRKLKRQRTERIDNIVEAVAKNAPLYKEVIKNFLLKTLYDGPILKPSRPLSSELLCDIFSNLDRNELEKCQLISKTWRNIVSTHADYLPLYSLFKFSIEKVSINTGQYVIQGMIYKNSNTLAIGMSYNEFEQDEKKQVIKMGNHMKAIKNVIFQVFELKGFDVRIEAAMQRDMQITRFMGLVKSAVGDRIKVVFCPLFPDFASTVTHLLLENYLSVYKVNFTMDTFLLWYFTQHEIDYSSTNKIKIYMEADNFPQFNENSDSPLDVLFEFISKAKFKQPQNVLVCIKPLRWMNINLFDRFLEKWTEFYSKISDPIKVVYQIKFYLRNGSPTAIDIHRPLIESIRNYARTFKTKYSYGKIHYQRAYEIKKLDGYKLLVIVDSKPIFENGIRNASELHPDNGQEIIKKIKFCVQTD